jgi:acetyl-CoA synthetase
MPSLPGYEETVDSFEWEDILARYDWDARSALNMAHEACDRHAASGRDGFVRVDETGDAKTDTFAELRDESNRIANALRELGVDRGDRVAVLLPKIPEPILTILGIWKTGAVHVPLFTAFRTGARVAHFVRAK